jgi:DUF1009 family protein
MLANLTEADKRMRDLDDQIAAEKQMLSCAIEQSSERMANLLLRRARLMDAIREVTGAVVAEAAPAQNDRQTQTGAKGNSSSIIVAALAKSGVGGLSGSEVNKVILDRGLSIAAADKAKARLRHAGMVELKDRRWRLTEKGKKATAGAAK